MLQSYLLTTAKNRSILEDHVSRKEGINCNTFTIKDYSIFIKSNKELSFNDVFYETEDGVYGLIGDIYNNDFCKVLLGPYRDNSQFNNITLFIALYKKFGPKAFSYLDGCFSVMKFNPNSSLEIFTSPMGNYPLYYYRCNCLWATNEVKFFRGCPSINLELKDFDLFRPDNELPENYTIFQYVQKAPAGSVTHFFRENKEKIKSQPLYYPQSDFSKDVAMNMDQRLEALDRLMRTTVGSYLNYNNGENISIALSGGIDSCIVAAYARKLRPNTKIHTFTFGSQKANEFSFAKLCSETIKADHHEIYFDESLFLEGLLKTIYYNEMFDGVFSEVHATMYLVYQQAQTFSKMVLNGFNADNLLGGLLDPTIASNKINKTLLQKLSKTKWTGEYNPYLANIYNLYEGSAYLNTQIVSFISQLDSAFKIHNKEAKFILKLLAEESTDLPKEIIWRKKIRLEEGCASEQMFSHFLKMKPGFYRKKHEFVYTIFKQLFSKNVPLNNIDLLEIRKSIS